MSPRGSPHLPDVAVLDAPFHLGSGPIYVRRILCHYAHRPMLGAYSEFIIFFDHGAGCGQSEDDGGT